MRLKKDASTETRLTRRWTARGSVATSTLMRLRVDRDGERAVATSMSPRSRAPSSAWSTASRWRRLLQAHVTGREPQLLGRFYGLGPRDTRAKIPEILTMVGFPPERSREPMEDLSRGMQQKIALARALLTAPVLLLLDEPTTGLDPRSKLEVQRSSARCRELHDSTICSAAHDMAEAEALPTGSASCTGRAAVPGERRGDPPRLRRRHARAGVPERDRALVRGRAGRGSGGDEVEE